jgi:hypothetical protein
MINCRELAVVLKGEAILESMRVRIMALKPSGDPRVESSSVYSYTAELTLEFQYIKNH